MKLDRNINEDGKGKYALVKLRNLRAADPFAPKPPEIRAIETLEKCGYLDWGDDEDSEFFVIRLKDINAEQALLAYADSAEDYDKEFAAEVRELAGRAAQNHLNCQQPD